MTKRFFVGLLFLLLISCGKNEKPIVAFYYWKTIFKLSPTEKEVLLDNEVSKLYIRYFDIGLHPQTKEPIPISPIRFQENSNAFDIVPVVFIQNKVMLLPNLDIDDLAQKTIRLVEEINAKNKISCQEIQIDCDWTLKSKDHYLKFIERFKQLSHKKLSSTIRLHQVKYFKKTKIPNVDSGVLMYYNMGTIAPDAENSIYSKKIAERYLESLKKYPLHLDFALPIYSWGVHIRDQKVIGLRSKLNVSELEKDSNFEKTGTIFFKVKKSNYKNGIFYEEDDLLKIEAISAKDLKEMANDLDENLVQAPREIIFYDLDEFNIKNYEKNIFKQVISCF
ncbi:hypothetical protein FLA105534_02412 [Flavobacterium bizetiae]|uniref:Lipoprotein n=1 Tax=Flavobacterium bizetiae TaxID=2704140 RepID=A0A6J4GLY6_9FLAO|nr:hypothetical protein [Flavobacterium bizetiae]CAA9199078.1 hypothetical protein FLA105534_02412 [Flavobacterium bizetiae]CAD5341778.1 hypothetical protein FLA105535_01754 [Flavobacterium bizetiae]CAD5347526.1 hypothetical protein FLA105534_01483 [Flavobacterium bizetiae]